MKVTNPRLKRIIENLKKTAKEKEIKLFKRIAQDLEKPARKRRIVNLSRINRFSKENEIIIVPGKVLGAGTLNHKLTIIAYSFSSGALEKINKAKAKAMIIEDIIKEDIKGKRIRIIG